ncbi:hypothetical protein SADUNF_Sadunf10G0198000 [Salix dunnii]|uniref:ABC transporter domain-containing protein n=1 Tax=Salix dunnii TaxID=1413687 RepID=A0A835JSA1_9ROSI|nr:hypothetical protein SADUNF_Sadunf10G0198000 [Salix dunnii]
MLLLFSISLIQNRPTNCCNGKESKEDASGTPSKAKVGNKDAKKEKLSVTAMLASMDQKPDKPKKGSSSTVTSSKPKPKSAPSYIHGIDLPPSDDEEEQQKNDLNKRPSERRQETLKDDRDAFTVVIGSRASVLDREYEGDANFKDITIDNFSVSARGKELLKNTSVKIAHGRRYGLVGPNGMGKSTVLKLLAWRKILVPKNIDVHLVEQELMGSDAAESQASKILAGLGFTEDMRGRPTRSFSGGWRMRISLARALFMQPTLLLLDEPTNQRVVLWLEEYLCRWKETFVVVSHDRDFLNTVCIDIIHLHDQKLDSYRGNFDEFEVGHEQRRKETNKKFEIYDKQMKAAKRSGNRVQQEKVKDRAKFVVAKEAAKNKSKAKNLLSFTPPLLQLIEVSFSYPNREDFKLSNVDVGIDMGTRVAVVGPNGAGKYTLLNLLAGDVVPTGGEVRRSQKLRIGRQKGLSKQEAVRGKHGKFGLPSHNHLTPIAKLPATELRQLYCNATNVSLLFYKKYGTPVLGPLIWLFSSVSVKNFTSLSYEMTQNMNTDEQYEFHSQKSTGTEGDD